MGFPAQITLLGTRTTGDNINEDYESFVGLLNQITEECIPKKTVCKHSKGWWSLVLGP